MCDEPRLPTPGQLTPMRRVPVEPAASTFAFPPNAVPDGRGKVVVGGDLDPGAVLAAYRQGLVPMRQKTGELAWWSPDPRGWTIGTPDDPPELAGGLYGLAIGGLFAGESMFHRRRDASKVALIGLVEALAGTGDGARGRRIIDVQWLTPHLASLGAGEVPRQEYLALLASALELPLPAALPHESP